MIAIDNTLLKEALHIFAAEENKAIEKMLESAPKPQESLYNYCNETAQKIANEQTHSLPFKKAIALLIAAVLIVSMLGVAAYALRDQIGGFFVDFFEKFVELTPDDVGESKSLDLNKIEIEYIPSDYIKTREKVLTGTALHEWKKGEDIITFSAIKYTTGSFAIDNENSNYTVTTIDDIVVHYTEKHGEIGVSWTDKVLIYSLSTTGLEWDEIEKIVKGISFSPEA